MIVVRSCLHAVCFVVSQNVTYDMLLSRNAYIRIVFVFLLLCSSVPFCPSASSAFSAPPLPSALSPFSHLSLCRFCISCPLRFYSPSLLPVCKQM